MAQFDGSCSCAARGTWTIEADNSDCIDSGSPTGLLVGLLEWAALLVVVLAFFVVRRTRSMRARIAKHRAALKAADAKRLAALNAADAKRLAARKAADAHGRLHPMSIRTLAGDHYRVAGWGGTTDLRQTVATEHPELGAPNGFNLLLDVTVVDGAAYGIPAHTSMLESGGPIELILRFIDTGAAEDPSTGGLEPDRKTGWISMASSTVFAHSARDSHAAEVCFVSFSAVPSDHETYGSFQLGYQMGLVQGPVLY